MIRNSIWVALGLIERIVDMVGWVKKRLRKPVPFTPPPPRKPNPYPWPPRR